MTPTSNKPPAAPTSTPPADKVDDQVAGQAELEAPASDKAADTLEARLAQHPDLPAEYVDKVRAGLDPGPPAVEPDNDRQVVYTPGGWQNVPRDKGK